MASQCCSIHMYISQTIPYKSSISIGFGNGSQPSVYYVNYISNPHGEAVHMPIVCYTTRSHLCSSTCWQQYMNHFFSQCLKYAFEIMHCGGSAVAVSERYTSTSYSSVRICIKLGLHSHCHMANVMHEGLIYI
jgi:hypothetical protein